MAALCLFSSVWLNDDSSRDLGTLITKVTEECSWWNIQLYYTLFSNLSSHKQLTMELAHYRIFRVLFSSSVGPNSIPMILDAYKKPDMNLVKLVVTLVMKKLAYQKSEDIAKLLQTGTPWAPLLSFRSFQKISSTSASSSCWTAPAARCSTSRTACFSATWSSTSLQIRWLSWSPVCGRTTRSCTWDIQRETDIPWKRSANFWRLARRRTCTKWSWGFQVTIHKNGYRRTVRLQWSWRRRCEWPKGWISMLPRTSFSTWRTQWAMTWWSDSTAEGLSKDGWTMSDNSVLWLLIHMMAGIVYMSWHFVEKLGYK